MGSERLSSAELKVCDQRPSGVRPAVVRPAVVLLCRCVGFVLQVSGGHSMRSAGSPSPIIQESVLV